MHRLYTILFVLILFGINSCGERVDLSNGTESKKLYLEAHIQPNSLPKASLRTTELYNVKDQEVLIATGDAAKIVLADIKQNLRHEFVYEGNGIYVINNPSLIEEGKEYEIEAVLNDYPEFEEVTSVITVPKSDYIERIVLNNRIKELIPVPLNERDNVKYTYDVDITIAPSSGQDFFMFEPRATLHFKNPNPLPGQDSFIVRNAGDRDTFVDFFSPNSTANGIHAAAHLPGVLVNLANTESNTINLIFSSSWVLQDSIDFLPYIDFRLNTLSDSYYNYNLAKSRQIKAAQTGLSHSVTSYSNIESGHGGFTALSSTIYRLTVTP